MSILLLLLASAWAAPFGSVPVQGHLTDSSGLPVEGLTSLHAILYDVDPLFPLWEDDFDVIVDKGTFTILLGEGIALDLAMFRDYIDVKLQLDVGTESLGPIPIGSVPYAGYAAHAGDAQTLQGQAAADFHPSTWTPDWTDLTGRPAGLDDGDDNTTYAAGTGLLLDGSNVFSLEAAEVESIAAGVCFDTEAELTAALDDNYLPAAYTPDWGDLTGVPDGIADGDDDTTYAAGTGVTLSGTTFSLDSSTVETLARGVAFDTEAELTAALDDNYLPASYTPGWSELTGVPADIADGDADTTYAGGTGVNLSGTTFSADAAYVAAQAKLAAFDTEAELTALLDDDYLPAGWAPDWSELTGIPGDIANGDADTTYSAGTGLTLSSTTFAVNDTYVSSVATSVCYDSVSELTTDLDSEYMAKAIGVALLPWTATLTGSATNIITYTNPGRPTDTLDLTGIVPGELRVSSGGLLAISYSDGVIDSRLYVDIDTSPRVACVLLHEEDDTARAGFYFATDGGNDVAGIWGNSTTGTFMLSREGHLGGIVPIYTQYRILCM